MVKTSKKKLAQAIKILKKKNLVKKKIIYLSGPMTGLPEWNFPEFNRVAAKLRALGHTVLNPAETLGGDTSKPRKFYMRYDIGLLLKCDTIVLLKNWRKSKGALVEVEIAKELELEFLDEDLQPYQFETICQEADRIVSSDRGNDYGSPEQDFERTGRMWGAILGIPDVTPEKVGLCMIALKLSREVFKHKRDNLVDICGYAKTVDMIWKARDKK